MKKFNSNVVALCGFALLMGTEMSLCSCSGAEEVMNPAIQESGPCANVCVQVSDFAVSMAPFPGTRAVQDPADYPQIGAITLAFYQAGTEIYKSTQQKSSAANFGSFSLSLPYGSYTMVVIGHNAGDGDVFTLTSPTEAGYSSGQVQETFSHTQSVTVSSTSTNNYAVTLNRVVSKLEVVSTDDRPAGIGRIRTTYSAGSQSFSPSTGLAVGNAGFTVTHTPSAAVGEPIDVNSFAFLASDEQTMDVTIEVLDEDENVITTRMVSDVPFKRNRQTRLRGALFGASLTCTFTIETDWLEPIVISF